MCSFGVGDRVEAVDECGVWSKAQVLAIEDEKYLVKCDGFGNQWNRFVEAIAIRQETANVLPKKRAIQEPPTVDLKRLQRSDSVWLAGGREVIVAIVDPIRKKIIVEHDDGGIEILGNEFWLQPPQVEPAHTVQQTKRRKTASAMEASNVEDNPYVEVIGEKLAEDHKVNQKTVKDSCVYIYYLRSDGMWLQVGDVVAIEGVPLPFIISSIFCVDGKVSVKLVSVDGSKLKEDFVITCGINYVRTFSGNKVSLCSSDKNKLENEAFRHYSSFMCGDAGGEAKLEMRRMILGHAMRVGLSGGFSNLSSIRFNLGPSDILLDGQIFNFVSLSAVSRFSLMSEGDFEFLDGLMGKEWDYKLGRGESSFFKYITELQIKRARDLSLIVTAKFANSQFGFSDLYRLECRAAIKDSKEQMALTDIA